MIIMGSVEALEIAHKAIDKFAVEVIRELFYKRNLYFY